MYMVERGEIEFECGGAVDAPSSAVTHRGMLDRSLVRAGGNGLGPTRGPLGVREGDTVEVPTS